MRILSTRLHGLLDHLVGALLLFSPYIGGFDNGGPEHWAAVLLGSVLVIYSLFTDYEFSLVNLLSMRTHLVLDATVACLLVASPWLFHFSQRVWAPFVVIGAFQLSASMLSIQIGRRRLARVEA